MQGQRSAVGSLPETLGCDHGSASNDAGMDQQICWNNMRTSAHNILPDYVTSTGHHSSPYMNSMSQGRQNSSGWIVGEPSSSGTLNHVIDNERKTEHGLSQSMVASGVAGPVAEERQYEPRNTLSLNNVNVNTSSQLPNAPLFAQSSSSAIRQDLNMNAGFIGHGNDDCQIVDCSNAYKFDVSQNTRIPSAGSSSDPFGLPSGSGGYLMEENDGSPGCSLEGRRLSCKRKALEGNSGKSSPSGSSSYFQPAESTVWHAVPSRYNAGSGLSISTASENILHASPSEQVVDRLGLGAGRATSGSPLTLNVAGNAESSQRNHRVRINPSRQQDSVPINIFSSGSTVVHSNVSSQEQSSRLLSLNNSADLRSPSPADSMSPQRQSIVVQAPALRRTPHSSRWNGGSSSRAVHSSSSGERDAILHEESNSIRMPRNISEHPVFVPANEMRNSAQNSTNWSLTGGNISIAGNAASSSRIGSSSGVHPLSGPNWGPHRNPPRYPRRLSEFVRRSLLSSAGSESGGQGSSNTPVHLGPSSQEMALPSGAGNQGHHPSHSRSVISLDRQLDGALRLPYSLQTFAAASEGRSRLVSEIRSVLDLMRRGEGLRFEDVMILDQSVFFGVADMHDRHRDMRLDVDNMSYEELLALEERIGNVNTGLSEETILSSLKQRKYFSIAMGARSEVEPCCVCQEEYSDGEDIGTLECGHEFHSECIKQWLMQKNLCPICKTAALNK
ncbi:E3 ubiquitin-protein ligase MBR2-like [Actinidia eriantha]|uniref:E3 ubiquitin-protein ligase MBR2-like n=1 Tax=Actinidia eriantha TaxID=165200 RepID=UPI002582AF1C|nr:E3 ubiquitin-protein ligase MBR2-like [Actinidia eriantha]XP_057490133.1 E3 ubiquitin-protein ligase MBR2-like [Actinidia eriantha]